MQLKEGIQERERKKERKSLCGVQITLTACCLTVSTAGVSSCSPSWAFKMKTTGKFRLVQPLDVWPLMSHHGKHHQYPTSAAINQDSPQRPSQSLVEIIFCSVLFLVLDVYLKLTWAKTFKSNSVLSGCGRDLCLSWLSFENCTYYEEYFEPAYINIDLMNNWLDFGGWSDDLNKKVEGFFSQYWTTAAFNELQILLFPV